MSRFMTAVVFLVLLFPVSRLFAIDGCLVNDSKRTAVITVIAGSDHFEKSLEPKSRARSVPKTTNSTMLNAIVLKVSSWIRHTLYGSIRHCILFEGLMNNGRSTAFVQRKQRPTIQ